VYSPAITDFIFMVQLSSYLFVTGPNVVKTVTHEDVTQEVLGGARTHSSISGVAHVAFQNDIEAIAAMREFYDFLPLSNKERPPIRVTDDPWDREEPLLDRIIPDDPNQPYDIKDVISRVVDESNFFEIMPEFAKNVVIGFGRMQGAPVGVVANQPRELAGCLDVDASIKAARFVRF